MHLSLTDKTIFPFSFDFLRRDLLNSKSASLVSSSSIKIQLSSLSSSLFSMQILWRMFAKKRFCFAENSAFAVRRTRLSCSICKPINCSFSLPAIAVSTCLLQFDFYSRAKWQLQNAASPFAGQLNMHKVKLH